MTPITTVIKIEAAVAGDLIFFDSPGDVAWVLKQAQKIAWTGDKNHVAGLHSQDPDGAWRIIQAEGKGVTDDKPLSLGPNDVVVRLPAACDRDKVLWFAREQVRLTKAGVVKYGFLTDVSILVTELSPKFVDVMRPNTWICSALWAEAMRYGGLYLQSGDIYQFAPDPLFTALTEAP